jgi:hypothetical protein
LIIDFDDAGKKNWAEFVQATQTLKPGLARDTPERQQAASNHGKQGIRVLVTKYNNFKKT